MMEKRVRWIQIMSFAFIGCWVLLFVVAGYSIYRLGRVNEQIEDRYNRLMEAVEAGFAVQEERLAAVGEEVRAANYRIRQVNQVYGDLLAEQKKRTLESVYDEGTVQDLKDEAWGLFEEGKYRQAHDLYRTIEGREPENLEVRFYRYYALFLTNRMDAEQYGAVKTAFSLLEKNGYTRKEMDDVVQFISLESGGMDTAAEE
jgi:uncharacterized protein (DUF927 family)